MADKQYEYRIQRAETNGIQFNMIWFRSTNYARISPYGWDTLTTSYPADDDQLIAAVKQLSGLGDCEFIPASSDVCESMFVRD